MWDRIRKLLDEELRALELNAVDDMESKLKRLEVLTRVLKQLPDESQPKPEPPAEIAEEDLLRLARTKL